MGSFKKLWALILALTICLSMGIPAMAAETGAETVFSADISDLQVSGKKPRSAGKEYWRTTLNTVEQAFYDSVKAGIQKLDKSYFSVTPPVDFTQENYTRATSAILADQTDFTFWVDKTSGMVMEDTGGVTTIYFAAINGYLSSVEGQKDGFNYGPLKKIDIDTEKTNALAIADAIVGNATGSSAEKVNFFASEICRLTTYNHAAATPDAAYGKPSQLTTVFEGGSVVCEGYAKAFEYLCSKAGIECVLAEGTINAGANAPAGAHMWNLVQLDGQWWTVDVTNCDSASAGIANYDLILIGTNNSKYGASQMDFKFDSGFNAPAPLATAANYTPGTDPATYTVNVTSPDASVTIVTNPAILTGLAANTEVTITVTPAAGYENPQLYVDNILVALNGNAYTFNIGTSNHTIRASATKPNTYKVTVQDGVGVTVAADKTTDLKLNDLVTVTITAIDGYESPVGLLDGTTKDLTEGKFTFNVTKNHTVSGRAVKETFVESVAVAPSAMTIGWSQDPASITGVEDLTATVTEKTGKTFTGNVTWTSSDPSILTVTQKAAYDQTSKTATAMVTPTGYNGTVTITATAETKTARCTITVTGGKDKPVINPEPPVVPSVPSTPPPPNSNYYPSSGSDSKKGRDVSDWVSPSEKSGGSKTSSAYKPVNETNVVNQTTIAVAAAIKAGDKTGTVTVRNALSISYNALKSMQAAAVKAGGTGAVLQADSMKGNAVESRIYIDSSKIPADMKGDLKLRVYTSNPSVKDHFTKYYKNKCVVVRFEQEGSFGMEIEVATKVDLSGMSTKGLVFYAYDSVKNSFDRIVAPKHYIDDAGYLHFFTSVGGNIIISDGPLAK